MNIVNVKTTRMRLFFTCLGIVSTLFSSNLPTTLSCTIPTDSNKQLTCTQTKNTDGSVNPSLWSCTYYSAYYKTSKQFNVNLNLNTGISVTGVSGIMTNIPSCSTNTGNCPLTYTFTLSDGKTKIIFFNDGERYILNTLQANSEINALLATYISFIHLDNGSLKRLVCTQQNSTNSSLWSCTYSRINSPDFTPAYKRTSATFTINFNLSSNDVFITGMSGALKTGYTNDFFAPLTYTFTLSDNSKKQIIFYNGEDSILSYLPDQSTFSIKTSSFSPVLSSYEATLPNNTMDLICSQTKNTNEAINPSIWSCTYTDYSTYPETAKNFFADFKLTNTQLNNNVQLMGIVCSTDKATTQYPNLLTITFILSNGGPNKIITLNHGYNDIPNDSSTTFTLGPSPDVDTFHN